MRQSIITKDMIANPKTKYGNGKSATRHFFAQRVSGAFNVLFVGFLIFVVVQLAGQDRVAIVGLMSRPVVGIGFAVLFAIVCFHMRLGMREIIEDYVHEPRTYRLSLSLNSFFAIAVGVIGVVSLLSLVFRG